VAVVKKLRDPQLFVWRKEMIAVMIVVVKNEMIADLQNVLIVAQKNVLIVDLKSVMIE
jgi:hypothetical protein